jgi:hypothetical protein
MCVANDVAPSEAFNRLNKVLPGTIFLNFGGKVPLDVEIARKDIEDAHFALFGMSNPEKNAAVEVAAAHIARDAGVPYGFYSDTFGAFGREWFKDLRNGASLVFVIVPGDVEAARDLYPNANVVCTGNPLWEDYFLPADSMKARDLMGAGENDFILLVSGEKGAANNIMLWGPAIEAAAEIATPHMPIRVVIAPHPGDNTDPEIYSPLLEQASDLGVTVWVKPREIKSDSLVPRLLDGGGVIVQRGNASLGIHGICRRLPVIDYYTPLAQMRLKRGSGNENGYFKGTRAVAEVYLYDDQSEHGTLAEALYRVMIESGEEMEVRAAAQEAAIPTLEPGAAIAKMKAAILDLVD